MKDGMTLWNERVRHYWNEAIRYLRLIGNSGFLFTVYFLILIGSFYYSELLKVLPESFPTFWIFMILFAFVLTRGRIRTFVKEADLVFLLPYESKLDRYFRASINYSFIFQAFWLTLIFIVLAPLYSLRLADVAGGVGYVLVLLILVKGWNLQCIWQEQRFRSDLERVMHFLLRLMVNAAFTFLLFSGAELLYVGAILLVMVGLYGLYYRKFSKTLSIKWDRLIKVEHQMVMLFYRIANAFTDVPQLKEQVRPRSYLNGLLPFLSVSRKSVYHFLFARTFIRSNDYFGIYVRLVAVGGLLVAIFPSGWMELVVLVLFMHMVMMQLSTIWYHYDTNMWVDLYPTKESERVEALTALTMRLLVVMTIVLTVVLVIFSTLTQAVFGLAIGLLFSYLASTKWVHKRKKHAWS